MTLIRMLLQCPGVSAEDIGVITAYKEDMHKLSAELRRGNIAVESSTVDSFQGREKKIMIVHYVAAFRGVRRFGFVSNSNRLCVATTRAKEFQFFVSNFSYWQQRLREVGVRKELRSEDAIKGVMEHAERHSQLVRWSRVTPPPGV